MSGKRTIVEGGRLRNGEKQKNQGHDGGSRILKQGMKDVGGRGGRRPEARRK